MEVTGERLTIADHELFEKKGYSNIVLFQECTELLH